MSSSSSTYLMYKGFPFPTLGYSEEVLSYVENEFQVLDDDIVNLTYPKSGTNWMIEILSLIQHDGDPTWTQSVVTWERAPWIEHEAGLKDALKYPPPRIITTHLPIHLFPKSFPHSKARVIYTMRNPRDVLVSYYHFAKINKSFKEPGSLQEFVENFLSGNLPYGSWFDHVKGWLKMKDRANFFFISYEELQQDLRGSVERICHFLDKPLNSQQIDSVVKNASFQTMKGSKMSNYSLLPEVYMDHKKGSLLRKGISGDWKNHFTVAQSEQFDRVYQENMRGVNLIFPWD